MNLGREGSQSLQMTIDPIELSCARLRETDAAVIDRIARLQLEARKLGLELHLVHVSPALCELVEFCGLTGALRVEVQRQTEEGEEARGVQEEGDVGDPAL